MIIINKSADYSQLGLGKAFVTPNASVLRKISHYTEGDDRKAYSLALFLNRIASFETKLKTLFLPIFATSVDECVYDVMSETTKYPISGDTSGLAFDSVSKSCRTAASSAYWQKYLFNKSAVFNDENAESYGFFAAVHDPDKQSAVSELMGYICSVPSGIASGTSTSAESFTRYRGLSFHSISDDAAHSATNYSDKEHITNSITYNLLPNNSTAFGRTTVPQTGFGHRIVAYTAGTTVDEELILREAIMQLDAAYL